jgi:hypothetical protein
MASFDHGISSSPCAGERERSSDSSRAAEMSGVSRALPGRKAWNKAALRAGPNAEIFTQLGLPARSTSESTIAPKGSSA